MPEIDIFALPHQTYFKNTQHEMILFEPEHYIDANLFLLSELSEQVIRTHIPAEHPSWQWKVIGHFGTQSESIILDSQTGQIYLYDWVPYPAEQIFLASSLNNFLKKFQGLAENSTIWDII